MLLQEVRPAPVADKVEPALHREPSAGRKPSICFVSETSRVERPLLDPSVRYRCFHPAEALSAQGHAVTVQSAAKFFAAPSFDHDVYVFHRPNSERPVFNRVIDHLSALGRTLIAEYDDLIFGGEETALLSSIVKNGNATAETAIRTFSLNQAALERFDRFSVSTAPLADQVRRIKPGAKVTVTPNELPDSILKPHLEARTAFRKRNPKVIGYFAGTRSHNSDFPIVKDVLHRVLSEDADARLLVVGPVDLPFGVAALPNVLVRDVVAYWHLPDLMAGCHTVIAPLEDTVFNDCKSRVKFLEAAVAGCRLIASPIPDMKAIGSSRITFAETQNEWYEALSAPTTDKAHHDRVRANADFVTRRQAVQDLKTLGAF